MEGQGDTARQVCYKKEKLKEKVYFQQDNDPKQKAKATTKR